MSSNSSALTSRRVVFSIVLISTRTRVAADRAEGVRALWWWGCISMSGLPSIMQRGYDEAMTAPHTHPGAYRRSVLVVASYRQGVTADMPSAVRSRSPYSTDEDAA